MLAVDRHILPFGAGVQHPLWNTKRLKVFPVGGNHNKLHRFRIEHEPYKTRLSDFSDRADENANHIGSQIE